MAKKMDSRSFAQSKRSRRQWLTFVRMCRYGINNFSRNAWLSLAATAVMTITLLVIFTTFMARTALVETADQVKNSVDMSVYLKTDTTRDQVNSVIAEIEKLTTVKSVSVEDPTMARQRFANDNKQNPDILAALNEADNRFVWAVNIKIADINNPSQLRDFVKNNQTYKKYEDTRRAPSFEVGNKSSTAIETIGGWVNFADRIGIGAAILFVAISSLIVFNTIRMAIFNRKEEIQMMKLIGADKGFIRGPFIIEAIMYGFIAAVIATAIGLTIVYSVKDQLQHYGIQMATIFEVVSVYIWILVPTMIFIGALIGIMSSLFATRRYLKI
jgi:cell division transport system permease protein